MQKVFFYNFLLYKPPCAQSLAAALIFYLCIHTPLLMLIVLQSASKLLDTGLNTVQSTLLLKKQVEVEKVQEDLDIKRRQFAERMTACKRKEEELKKKQTQVCMYNFQRKLCRLVISQFLHCWFSLSRMSFKIDQNKKKKSSIDKVQNLGNERR